MYSNNKRAQAWSHAQGLIRATGVVSEEDGSCGEFARGSTGIPEKPMIVFAVTLEEPHTREPHPSTAFSRTANSDPPPSPQT